MSNYNLFAGCLVLLIVVGGLIRWFAGSLFPRTRQEQQDEEAYGDASLLDRDGGRH